MNRRVLLHPCLDRDYSREVLPKISVLNETGISPESPVEVSESSESVSEDSKTSTRKIIFTLDDIPTNKWPERLHEFHAWLETRKLTEDSHYNVLLEFVSRLTGMLKDW
ncbi:hypothetical protein V6Z12_D09G191600 [Gossypium hirsutum]